MEKIDREHANRWLAENIMSWTDYSGNTGNSYWATDAYKTESECISTEDWNPIENRVQMWNILDRMIKLGFSFHIDYTRYYKGNEYSVSFSSNKLGHCLADSAIINEAVYKAAQLVIVELEKLKPTDIQRHST